jgi:PAS domain-containing protein
MQRHVANDPLFEAAADNPRSAERELGLLRDVLRLLPAGVTVQDEQGDFLIVNDAAAAQLGLADGASTGQSPRFEQRREAGCDVLRTGQPAITEECHDDGKARLVLLTNHRPVRIGGRGLLLSSSTDISEQKAF